MHLKLKNLLLDSSDSDDWNFLENKINLINGLFLTCAKYN